MDCDIGDRPARTVTSRRKHHSRERRLLPVALIVIATKVVAMLVAARS